jgi:spore germination protein KB
LLPKDMAFVLDYLDVIVWKWTWLIEFALPMVGLWLAALLPRKKRVV